MTVNNIGKPVWDRTARENYPCRGRKGQESGRAFVPGGTPKAAGEDAENRQTAGMAAGSGIQEARRELERCFGGIGTGSTKLFARTENGEQDAVRECPNRPLTYEKSDFAKVYAQEGFSIKAKADRVEGKVYIQQKFEDGTIRSYEADPDRIDRGTADRIGQAALAAWDNAGGEPEDTAQEFYGAMLAFYERVEEQIKNGPPKFPTGGAEYSLEEWEKLIEDLDDYLDAVQKEQAERAQAEQEAEKACDEVSSELIEKLLADREETAGPMQRMEGRATSGIIGMTVVGGADGRIVCAGYASDSSDEDPVLTVGIRTQDGRQEEAYRVRINDINPADATELEMFALCCYWKEQGKLGEEAYRNFLDYADYCGSKSETMGEFTELRRDYRAVFSGAQAKQMEERYQIGSAWRDLFLELLDRQMDALKKRLRAQEEKKNEEEEAAETAVGLDELLKPGERQESGTASRVVERADGTRVLEVTEKIGETEVKTYLEIEKGAVG